MTGLALLALLQTVNAADVPETSGYMRAAYLAIGCVLILYALSLWGRWRKVRGGGRGNAR